MSVLLLTADRGMAGAYTATVLRAAEKLFEQLAEEGKEVDLYVVGRRGIGYYTFRDRHLVRTWEGQSDKPDAALARAIADAAVETVPAPAEEVADVELHRTLPQPA